jgi:hypothetical protein
MHFMRRTTMASDSLKDIDETIAFAAKDDYLYFEKPFS